MELEVIELTIDDLELDRVEAIAFVDNPAIQVNWMAFNRQEPTFKFETQSEEKRIVAGALMIPDMNIYRNMDGKEFFVKFSKETIEAIVNKFMKEGKIAAFNFMHDDGQPIKDVYIQQSFIIDTEKGINPPKGFEQLPSGTWFGYIKVDNEQVWNDYIKTGQLKGFSVEGTFSEKTKFKNNNIMDKFTKIFNDFKARFAEVVESNPSTAVTQPELGKAMLADGTEIMWEGELVEGAVITLADGSAAPDGEHTLQDGTVISITGGSVVAIAKPTEEEVVSPEMQKMSEELAALKLENEELKKQIGTLPTTEAMSSEIEKTKTEFKEMQKQMFDLVESLNEKFEASKTKQTFKKSDHEFDGKANAILATLKANHKRD